MHLGLKSAPHNLSLGWRIPVPLPQFQMAPILRFIISSGSKKKEPRCAWLSETKASHAHRMWAAVSSSVPHFLQMGFLRIPITYRCLLRVLYPVRRPVTTLDCVLLKDSNRAFVAVLRPEINFRACVWVLQGPRQIAKRWLSTRLLILLLIFCLETPTNGSELLMCTNKTDLQIMKVKFK